MNLNVKQAVLDFNERRIEKKAKQKYKDGFGWAMTAYYVEHRALLDIDVITSPPHEFKHIEWDFNQGARTAMDVIAISLIKHGEYNGPNA